MLQHNLLSQFKFLTPIHIEKLSLYSDTLIKWQTKFNLVGPDTIDDLTNRHFVDSIQLFPLIKNTESSIIDIGSGAGFPGLVLSILGCNHVTLVERNLKKCAFLREVIRLTGAGATVISDDIGNITESFDMAVSRAVASITDLLDMSKNVINKNTFCIFPKGQKYAIEVDEALQKWGFTWNALPSLTDENAAILTLANVEMKYGRSNS